MVIADSSWLIEKSLRLGGGEAGRLISSKLKAQGSRPKAHSSRIIVDWVDWILETGYWKSSIINGLFSISEYDLKIVACRGFRVASQNLSL